VPSVKGTNLNLSQFSCFLIPGTQRKLISLGLRPFAKVGCKWPVGAWIVWQLDCRSCVSLEFRRKLWRGETWGDRRFLCVCRAFCESVIARFYPAKAGRGASTQGLSLSWTRSRILRWMCSWRDAGGGWLNPSTSFLGYQLPDPCSHHVLLLWPRSPPLPCVLLNQGGFPSFPVDENPPGTAGLSL